MTPLVGACERTSDVALTFGWLLALGLRLLRLLLLQLPAPLSLQHWVLILGLPVDMTLGRRKKEGRVDGGWRNKEWRIGNRMREQEVNISRISGAQQGRENRHRGEDKVIEERDRVKRGRGTHGDKLWLIIHSGKIRMHSSIHTETALWHKRDTITPTNHIKLIPFWWWLNSQKHLSHHSPGEVFPLTYQHREITPESTTLYSKWRKRWIMYIRRGKIIYCRDKEGEKNWNATALSPQVLLWKTSKTHETYSY